ncbi:MAG: hypothetical protein NT041_02310, partial [Candidatus Vogelbacteria bacterium]|nr:hypothetical protein [Candidatus Vogelbacteria bacterium]
ATITTKIVILFMVLSFSRQIFGNDCRLLTYFGESRGLSEFQRCWTGCAIPWYYNLHLLAFDPSGLVDSEGKYHFSRFSSVKEQVPANN